MKSELNEKPKALVASLSENPEWKRVRNFNIQIGFGIHKYQLRLALIFEQEEKNKAQMVELL